MNEVSLSDGDHLHFIADVVKSVYFNERVVIVTNLKQQHHLPDMISVGDHRFELRHCSCTYNERNGTFSGESFSRHGKYFNKWWHQYRNDKVMIQIDEYPSINKENRLYTLAYIKLDELDEQSFKMKFLKLLGGQVHVQCIHHKLPLIVSRGKNKCSCEKRKEYLCCSVSSCNVCICKKCFTNYDEDVIKFIGSPDIEEMNEDDSESENDEQEDSFDEEDGAYLFEHENNEKNKDDNMDEYLGMADIPDIEIDDISETNSVNSMIMELNTDEDEILPTTNAAEDNINIETETAYGGNNNEFTISGSGLLCECTTALTRKRHDIHGSKIEKFFVQRFCASTKGTSFPLLYPESAMFTSIFWSTASDNYSIAGALPSPLISGSCKEDGFADMPTHIRSRVTNASSSTCSDYRYLIFGYDILCSIAANHNDMRSSGKGMTAANDSVGGLDLRGKDDSNFLHSIDSRQMVKNLCSSQEFFQWDIFLTFTCNMRKHFGTKPIRQWLDDDDWKEYFPKWNSYHVYQQKEIERAMHQAASGLFLRVWEEVSAIFIDYLKNSDSSPFTNMIANFARKEYQASKGNLSHIHFLGKCDIEDHDLLYELVRNNVIDIIKPDEINALIEEGVINHEDDVLEIQLDGLTYLIHTCNARCQVPNKDGVLVCRATNFQKSKENTKHVHDPLPNNFSKPCLQRLEKAGLLDLETNEIGEIISFKSEHDYLHPKKHIPPWKYGDPNISPCETKTFSICRSMQNIQCLCGAGGGSCKYCCKYAAKIDKNNYFSISTNVDGSLIRRDNMLHNTKRVTSDKVQQKEREKKRSSRHPTGTVICTNEILHHILKYPEVLTDLIFTQIQTTSIETRTRCSLRNPDGNNTEDDTTIEDINECRKHLQEHRHFTQKQQEVHEDMELYKDSVKVDKITQFSLRPPELLNCVDMVGKYYRWFDISSKPLKNATIYFLLNDDIYKSVWIDGKKCQILLRLKALPELILWLDEIENEGETHQEIIDMFRYLDQVLNHESGVYDEEFYQFAYDHLLCDYDDGFENHLPIPVYSYIKPTMAPEFILHILLSMGRYKTERELLLQNNLKDCFAESKLVGTENDINHLEQYSNIMMNKFFKCQLVWYPNGQRIIDGWIIQSGDIFDSVIIKNEIPMLDMPAVQLSALLLEKDNVFEQFQDDLKKEMIKAAIREVGDAFYKCNIPSFNHLINATQDTPLNWNPVTNFKKSSSQSEASYNEQLFAIRNCMESIDKYGDVMNNDFIKNFIIAGFPGGGKTFIMMYMVLYARSQGLTVVTVAMIAHRAIQLGGIHWHKLLCIPVDRSNNMSVYRMAELAIRKMEMYHPMRIEFIKSIHIIANDEIGQSPAEFDSVCDNVLRLLCGYNIYKARKLVIATYDPTQLQPIKSQPLLVSPNIIPCYKIIQIRHSVRTQNHNFYRLQQIARMNYKELNDNADVINEFEQLCEGFTYVESWDDPKITPDTFRIYARNIPAKEASRNFVESVKRIYNKEEYIIRQSIDLQRQRYSHQDWTAATSETKNFLDQMSKEPEIICFFKGAVYQCTFNKDGFFSQSQLALCYDLPSQNDVDNFRKIKVLVFPSTIKYDSFKFDPNIPKSHYISLGFKEVAMEQTPENIHHLHDMKYVRRQYGLRHYVTGTIHSAMGDTYNRMAISVSDIQKIYSLWDKGQLVVIISRTRLMKNTIFVGQKNEIINGLKRLLTKRTQWCDYIDQVISITTVDDSSLSTNNETQSNTFNQINFPFRICDISLPQDQTGAVYFLMSKKDKSTVFIDKTMCLRTTIRKQFYTSITNSQFPLHLRPFVMIAYICGFQRNIHCMQEIKEQWIDQRDNDVLNWARNGTNIIRYDTDLKLVLLLRE